MRGTERLRTVAQGKESARNDPVVHEGLHPEGAGFDSPQPLARHHKGSHADGNPKLKEPLAVGIEDEPGTPGRITRDPAWPVTLDPHGAIRSRHDP